MPRMARRRSSGTYQKKERNVVFPASVPMSVPTLQTDMPPSAAQRGASSPFPTSINAIRIICVVHEIGMKTIIDLAHKES